MPSGWRLALVVLWSAGLGISLTGLAFLFFPILSHWPLGWGLGLGAGLWLSQLWWSPPLLAKLLGLSHPDPKAELIPLEGKVPFLFLWTKGVGYTEGLELSPERARELERQLAPGLEGRIGRYLYLSSLAGPCLLRAFAAVTEDYGRLRFAQGPLWHLGRLLSYIADLLEAPWRWGRRLPRWSGELKVFIDKELCQPAQRQLAAPVWMGVLDLLSPLSWPEVQRAARYRHLGLKEPLFPAPQALWGAWLPWGLAFLLALWVMSGQGIWGAPALFWGLGYVVKIDSEYHLGGQARTLEGTLEWGPYPYERYLLEGKPISKERGGALLEWGAEEGGGQVLLSSEWPKALSSEERVRVEGWLDARDWRLHPLWIEVPSLERRYNYYPRFKRLIFPYWVAGMGLLWSIMQGYGI